MKIQYMSDLHLEFFENWLYVDEEKIPVTGDILVIAGDTCYIGEAAKSRKDFWEWASKYYRQTLIVPGNHEFYDNSDVMERGDSWQWEMCENVSYYYNKVVRIDDVDFVLTTLWSKIPDQYMFAVSRGLNDFYKIMYDGRRLTTDDFNAEHEKCLKFVKQAVEKSTAKHIVVVTHHLPTLTVVAPQHKNSPLNGAFATELGSFIADSRIDTWIYGHSHTNIDTVIGETKIICNQLGYVHCNEHLLNAFVPGKMIDF
jgi:predicted phosphohydrolase